MMLCIASMSYGVYATKSYSAYAAELERFEFVEPHLGTIIELKLYAPDETAANEAARSAYARVRELDLIFSDYKPESEAMRLCDRAGSGQPVAVSAELFDVLSRALIVSEASDGAFDVTVGPLVTLWRRARKERVLPNGTEIDIAKRLVDWRLVAIDPVNRLPAERF